MSPRFSIASIDFSVVEVFPRVRHRRMIRLPLPRLSRPGERRVDVLRRSDLRLPPLLLSVDAVGERPPLVLDTDLTAARLSHFDVRASHRVSGPRGGDLIDHVVVGE